MILRVTLPWAKTSELSANSRLHWRKRAKLVKAQRRVTDALAREAGWHKARIPADAELRMTLIYCPPSTVTTVDDDNVVTANKGARDALAAVLRIDDGRIKLQEPIRGERCKAGAVIVEVEVV
ncbi:hypothetical protein ACDP63_11260 [Paracoccus sp. P2]|uniref:hypothetical protein n=1 Tax=Paracoccus sp. P2 TaxID=3248840 RepID=UPI00391EEECA